MPNITDLDDDKTAAMELMGPGARLRLAREQLGLSIADVALHLHLRARLIEDIEIDNYQEMPQLVFLRGYLRSYAKLVKHSPDDIIKQFNQLNVTDELNSNDAPVRAMLMPNAYQNLQTPPKNKVHPWRWLFFIIVMVLIAAGFSIYNAKLQSSEQTLLPETLNTSNVQTNARGLALPNADTDEVKKAGAQVTTGEQSVEAKPAPGVSDTKALPTAEADSASNQDNVSNMQTVTPAATGAAAGAAAVSVTPQKKPAMRSQRRTTAKTTNSQRRKTRRRQRYYRRP